MTYARHSNLVSASDQARPIWKVEGDAALPQAHAAWAKSNGFKGKAGQLLVVPDAHGEVAGAYLGTGKVFDPVSLRSLAARLPQGDWKLVGTASDTEAELAAVAFGLGGYVFDRYKPSKEKPQARLVVDDSVDLEAVHRIVAACALTREMVDTPAQDMGPLQLETIGREIAEENGASFSVITGDDLLEQNYPAVHAVGRAATPARAPRVIEIGWNLDKTDWPLVALVGKGVVFDTGGLDLKGAAGMRNMKKDMGGAAHALSLGRLVMQAGLKLRLVVLVAAVENAVSGDAFRPGDILSTRKGLTIEIGNTDAEGRLILSDILTRAGELEPDLTVDFATLTGAARIALGPELPPLYTTDDDLAQGVAASAKAVSDPLWRMPLWDGYGAALDSEIADVRNDSAAWAQAGSVTAALFLQKFAPQSGSWAHMDVFAWNPRNRPGYAEGGEAQTLRAWFHYLQQSFANRAAR
ncbi:leucyl aminopeptidase family protein [Brevundimonas sp.]|uniref:leucyl aminopeptidase family protein n=1 Tax=Brevundimonas sp. TaxID=1871086 RepID=UPI002FC59E23